MSHQIEQCRQCQLVTCTPRNEYAGRSIHNTLTGSDIAITVPIDECGLRNKTNKLEEAQFENALGWGGLIQFVSILDQEPIETSE